MRNFLIVMVLFAVCVVGASAIAWPVYTALPSMQAVPFDRFTKWFALLTVAAATVGVYRSRRLEWAAIRFTPAGRPQAATSLGLGLACGILLFSLLSVMLYLLDVRVASVNATPSALVQKLLLSILPTALLISLIEEVYFRGIQCGELIKAKRTLAAVVLPAFFYSGVHFLNPKELARVADPEWFYGLTLLLNAPAGICRVSDCAATAATLLMAGVFLGMVRVLSGNLLVCIGIHAGWIVSIKMTQKLTDFNPDADFAWLARGQDHLGGILATVWLSALCIWLGGKLIRKTARPTGR